MNSLEKAQIHRQRGKFIEAFQQIGKLRKQRATKPYKDREK